MVVFSSPKSYFGLSSGRYMDMSIYIMRITYVWGFKDNPPRREQVPEPPKFDHQLSVTQLRKKIIEHYASSAFNKCTRQPLPLMKGEPLPIPVRKDAKPVAVHTPVPVPLHWEEKVKRDLERDVSLGVMEPVPLNTPVTWCHRMVTVPKHNGEPRRTVDMQSLNKASVRQTHPTKSPFMLASSVPAGKIKSVLDVWNSFHSVPLVEEERDKTTFITPWGRYRYRVSPQGYLASMDGYTHRFSLIAREIEDKLTIVDDTLLFDDNLEENFYHSCQLLSVGHKAGLIFNPDKFQFGQETVEFAGLDVTMDGVRPCKKFLESIRSFPRPNSLSEARSFFGMVNQVAYSFSMSAAMEPFRYLLKPDTWSNTSCVWTEQLEEKFNLAKDAIVKAVTDGVRFFDVKRQTCLATDWSKQGIGFFLLQKWCQCQEIHPRYSPVEGRRVIVPTSCRQRVLQSLHSAHQGTAKMLERAKHSVYRPGIVDDLEQTRKRCSICDRNAPSQAQMPPLQLESPEFPFQMIAMDYFDVKGKSWLAIADRFSGWLSLFYFPREASSQELINTLKNYFCTYGIAEQVSSDDGPQFRSTQFKQFLNNWGVNQHRVSSSYHPHSNLRAETAVKSGKRLLLDNTRSDGSPLWDRICRAMMQRRNTPDAEYGLSPSQLIFGRPIRDFLPTYQTGTVLTSGSVGRLQGNTRSCTSEPVSERSREVFHAHKRPKTTKTWIKSDYSKPAWSW